MAEIRTLTLADFLLARIGEDETHYGWLKEDIAGESLGLEVELGTRVLAECEAKRRIVEWVQAQHDGAPSMSRWADRPLQLLALPYADHPDYRDEWRP